MHPFEQEEHLTGGNVSRVVRIGKTVRREIKPESPCIHRVLHHLEKKGYRYAPAFLGIDDQQREIVSYLEGEAGNYPVKNYMWSDEALRQIAHMLREYHEAIRDFPIDSDWEPIDLTPGPAEVLCHNDFAIYNLIFRDQKPAGIIDFDVAAPGPRLWDIAYTLYTCVPLSRFHYDEAGNVIPYTPETDDEQTKQRVQLFFQSYGVTGIENGWLDMVLLRLAGLCQTMKRKAAEGDPAFQRMIHDGHDQHYEKDREFIRTHGHKWE